MTLSDFPSSSFRPASGGTSFALTPAPEKGTDAPSAPARDEPPARPTDPTVEPVVYDHSGLWPAPTPVVGRTIDVAV